MVCSLLAHSLGVTSHFKNIEFTYEFNEAKERQISATQNGEMCNNRISLCPLTISNYLYICEKQIPEIVHQIRSSHLCQSPTWRK